MRRAFGILRAETKLSFRYVSHGEEHEYDEDHFFTGWRSTPPVSRRSRKSQKLEYRPGLYRQGREHDSAGRDYRVKLDNNQAVFRAANSDRTYNVPVKLATEPRKYDETKLELKVQGDTEVIEAIDLAGTATKLEFGE